MVEEYLNSISSRNSDEYTRFLHNIPVENLNIRFFNTFEYTSIERFMGMLFLHGLYVLQNYRHKNSAQIKKWEKLQISDGLSDILSEREISLLKKYAPMIMKSIILFSKMREIGMIVQEKYIGKYDVGDFVYTYRNNECIQIKLIKSIYSHHDILDDYMMNLEIYNEDMYDAFIERNIITSSMLDDKITRSIGRWGMKNTPTKSLQEMLYDGYVELYGSPPTEYFVIMDWLLYRKK